MPVKSVPARLIVTCSGDAAYRRSAASRGGTFGKIDSRDLSETMTKLALYRWLSTALAQRLEDKQLDCTIVTGDGKSRMRLHRCLSDSLRFVAGNDNLKFGSLFLNLFGFGQSRFARKRRSNV